VSPTGLLGVQGWYDNALWVSPTDSNHVIVGGVRLQQSRDGGSTWQGFSASIHPDHHAIVADPKYDGAANRRVFFANDGGVFSVDDIETVEMTGFRSLNNNLGVTQFYGGAGHAATGTIVGGAQDNGMLVWTPLSGTSWTQRIAGDGGYAASDPADSQYFYGEGIYLRIFRSVNGGRGFTYVGGGITDAGANANFIAPFVLDPGNPQRMFAGGASLWRGDNVKSVAPVWKAIKPSAQRDYISAIAVAPGNSDLVWVGHDLGRVFKSANATSSSPAWTAVVVPTSAMITHVAISAFDSNTVYVTTGSFGPTNILKTTDGGATWIDATGAGTTGLPDAPVNDLEIDPVYPDTIYAATEVGVFASVDGGVHWDLPQDGPANVCVDDLFWMGSRLVAVTHGRGMFSIDVSGDGAPLLTKSIGSIVFGKQAVGATSAAQTVTISNVGPGPLTIASVRLAGAQPGDFAVGTTSCAGASLAPGAGCFIRLTFRPTTGGARSATLTIASNAASSPDTVALSGAGVAPAGALPSGWTSQDVGSVGIVGAASYSNGTFTVRGAGADIWGTTDAFRFVYQTLSGDGAIVARVAGVDNVHAWTKAGVMMRATTAAGSANVALFVTPAKGVAFQRRTTTGGATTSTAAAGAAPRWLKLSRAGSIVKASMSVDGAAWTLVGRQSMAWGGSLLVGVAVTSHAVGQAASAMFDNVSVVTSPGPSALPARWQTRDVGLVGAAGSTSESGASLSLKGAGDIWGTADAFRYAYAPATAPWSRAWWTCRT
jgi:hypothetical protein